jgi:hypothetical protein
MLLCLVACALYAPQALVDNLRTSIVELCSETNGPRGALVINLDMTRRRFVPATRETHVPCEESMQTRYICRLALRSRSDKTHTAVTSTSCLTHGLSRNARAFLCLGTRAVARIGQVRSWATHATLSRDRGASFWSFSRVLFTW